ncbi:high mobility group B protein 6 [Lycium barbarum]|uniref:high mobility group B protein 6 n=1 Tax=Lycium barbarum TaxID=112863 RepID=UPI00293F3C36|nr:high mobility group B protein 6 [Lycium barbarum]
MASTAPSPFPNNQIHPPKIGRKPLQPKNIPSIPLTTNPKQPQKCIQNSNKENLDFYSDFSTTKKATNPISIIQAEPFDSSLAEELSAIREKLERLRIDREKTEKMLKERDLMLDLQMKEMLNRGEEQKELELEVDRLFRLKELRLSCTLRISPIRTLREKEEEKKIKGDHLKELNYDEEDEIMTDSSSDKDPSA